MNVPVSELGKTDVSALMTIGDFSRSVQLSVKALRFYHRVGILVPERIDPSNGYRSYGSAQIADAQVVKQLRALDLPVDSIRHILASNVAIRHQLISRHLEELEERLNATQAAVTSLRALLEPTLQRHQIENRSVPATPVLIIRGTIDAAEMSDWYGAATRELSAISPVPGTPHGGLWSTDLFLRERGDVALFIPVHGHASDQEQEGRARHEILPPVDLAVLTHRETDETMALSYGALGAHVSEHEIGLDGPLRETYLETPDGAAVTEVGWPIFRAAR